MLLIDNFKINKDPEFLRGKCIKNYLSKLLGPKTVTHPIDKKQIVLVLTYLGSLSFEIRSRLQRCFNNYIPFFSIKVVYQSKNGIVNVFKDVSNTKLSSHVVYKFMCSCCNETYYDQIQRHFL